VRTPRGAILWLVATPRVLAILPAFIPSTIISVVKPLVRLHHLGRVTARVALEHFTRVSDLEWAEVAVFCRNSEPRFVGHRDWLRATGVPYIYDLDDNLFEIPADTEEGQHQREPERLAELRRYLEGASLVRVYSNELLRRVQPLNPRAEKVGPSLDWALVPAAPPRRDGTRIRIVYVTSRLHDALAGMFWPDLQRLLQRYGGRVDLTFWGAQGAARGLPGVTRLRPTPDYDDFFRRLARRGFDIGLAPLVDDAFHRAKTNNKYREYGACRIAGVYSDVEVYSSCVRHGETGLLVPPREGAWLEAVGRLVDDIGLREHIQDRAHADVRARYSQEQTEEAWIEQIERLRGAPRGPVAIARLPAPRSFEVAELQLGRRLLRVGRRLRRSGLRATLAGVYWYLHGLWTMLRLRRELSR
jgi:glycosyltransferase involved in cell wall biosynthesis